VTTEHGFTRAVTIRGTPRNEAIRADEHATGRRQTVGSCESVGRIVQIIDSDAMHVERDTDPARGRVRSVTPRLGLRPGKQRKVATAEIERRDLHAASM
jgi:hypothetical protein